MFRVSVVMHMFPLAIWPGPAAPFSRDVPSFLCFYSTMRAPSREAEVAVTVRQGRTDGVHGQNENRKKHSQPRPTLASILYSFIVIHHTSFSFILSPSVFVSSLYLLVEQ